MEGNSSLASDTITNNLISLAEDPNYRAQRISIMPCNSVLGTSLIDALRNDDETENCHRLIGFMDENEDNIEDPTGLNLCITDSSFEAKFAAIVESNVLILEVLKTDLDFLDFLLFKLNNSPLDSQLAIIVVSSALLWSENKVSELNKGHSTRIDMGANSAQDLRVFTEDYLSKRKCLPCFELHRMWEERFLKAGQRLSYLNTTLIVPGVLYGRGEDHFYDLFEGLFDKKRKLTVFGDGDNYVPMCHVSDLSSCVKVGWLLIF